MLCFCFGMAVVTCARMSSTSSLPEICTLEGEVNEMQRTAHAKKECKTDRKTRGEKEKSIAFWGS